MKKMIEVFLLELKKLVVKKEFAVGLILVSVLGCGMIYGAWQFPDSFGLENVRAFYGNFAGILLLYMAAKSMGEEFDLKTITFLFTSGRSRGSIYVTKIFSIIGAAVITGIAGAVLYIAGTAISSGAVSGKEAVSILISFTGVYALYGFATGACAILLVTLTGNTIHAFIGLIVLFWVLPGIMQMVLAKAAGLEQVFSVISFYFADNFLMYQNWNLANTLGLVTNGILFLAVGVAVIRQKDIS